MYTKKPLQSRKKCDHFTGGVRFKGGEHKLRSPHPLSRPQTKGFHASSMGGFNACLSIFHHQTVTGVYAQSLRCKQKKTDPDGVWSAQGSCHR